MSVSAKSPEIVSFRRPPLTEVVVGVAFRDAQGLTPAHLGDCWQAKWAEKFPRVEEHAPYAPPMERFDVPPHGPTVSFELSTRPAIRLWFVTLDGRELIQVQKDWFACNWRKVEPGSEYDRWPARRAAFEKYFTDLVDFVEDRGLGKVAPMQCEVTYVNHIVAGEGWARLGELPKVFRLGNSVEGGFLPEPEQSQLGASFVITDDEQRAIGRLHVTAQPAAFREGGQPLFVMNLTARGLPQGSGASGALAFLDRGREWIVRAFAEITTPEMQSVWGRDG